MTIGNRKEVRPSGTSAVVRAGLKAVAELRRLADTLELRQVEAALAVGLGWVDIATCSGVSRQNGLGLLLRAQDLSFACADPPSRT